MAGSLFVLRTAETARYYSNYFPLPVGGKGKVLLRRTHSPDRQTVVAVAAVHALEVRKEAKDPRAARVVRVERTRPVEAAAPGSWP